MKGRLELAIVAVLLLTSSGFATTARAYRTLSELAEFRGSTVRWEPTEMRYLLQQDGAPGVSVATMLQPSNAAFATWNDVECSTMQLSYAGTTATSAAPDDSTNTIEWLRSFWSELGFSPDIMATTDLLYERDGEDGPWRIVESDIYLNAVDYRWSAESGAADTDRRSVRAVLTHEAGHVLGLLHWPCEPGGLDGAPDCAGLEGGQEHIMYPLYVSPGHLQLSSDDEAGVCSLYGCEAGCAMGTACVDGACQELCGDAVCTGDEACVEGRCQLPCDGPCPPPPVCASSSDCGAGYQCEDAVCVASGGQLGDPCATDEDCTLAECTPDGYCAAECSGTACPTGYTCDESADSSVCIAEAGVLGDACAEPSDCASRLCLSEASSSEPSTCTRGCIGTFDCPADYACELVEDRSVCVPLLASGCSVRPRSRARGVTVLLPLALLLIRQRRRW